MDLSINYWVRISNIIIKCWVFLVLGTKYLVPNTWYKVLGTRLVIYVKTGAHFLAKCAKTARGVLQDEPPGTLHRIYY